MKLTPSHLALIRHEDHRGSRLQRLIVGGEALSTELARGIHHCFGGGVEIINEYGPTEATVGCMLHRFDPAVDLWVSVPIGLPAANVQVYVLDASGEPLPAGIPGELSIGGAGLAQGYLGLPAVSGASFVPDPFSQSPGVRLYRTGDLVRGLPHRNLEFLGRIDEQIKLRGFRIEPGQIEAILSQHSEIQEVAVVAREDVPGDKRLAAYLVPQPGRGLDVANLRRYARERLPEAMVPSAWVELSEIPLNVSGKVDRRALPVPASPVGGSEQTYAAPQSAVEQQIVAIWQEVLRVEQVGLHDNFFDLGGHSMLLVQAQRRLAESFGREVPLVDLFRYPTVSALAGSLDPRGKAVSAEPARPVLDTRLHEKAEIAVVGLSCRFPGANDGDEFWRNLEGGVESITFFTDEELLEAGIPRQTLENPNYVKAYGMLDDVESFDAHFFGFTPTAGRVHRSSAPVFSWKRLGKPWKMLVTVQESFPGASASLRVLVSIPTGATCSPTATF